MTEPEDHTSTRPISVAELLAKNGNIGSPPVGGRRRRRRGDADSVTVAELTGEIPIVDESTQFDEFQDGDLDDGDLQAGDLDDGDLDDGDYQDEAGAPATNGAPEFDADEADYEDHLKRRDVVADPVEFAAPARRPPARKPLPSPSFFRPASGAEQMSPDPRADDADDADDFAADEELIRSLEGHEPLSTARNLESGVEEVPSYLRSGPDTRSGGQPAPEDIDLGADEPSGSDSAGGRRTDSALLRGVWAVAQSLLAVVFGAVLFVAFELLWKWNNVVALVLAVLVILGLVAGVRVVRKTEDIGSTLIAVAVGALVTFGPLALLSTH